MNAQTVHNRKIIPIIAALLFIITAVILMLINGIPQIGEEMVTVPFSLDAAEARTVSVVGDFNQWDPHANVLQKDNNIWHTEILLKKGNTYLYNFLIDGEKWITDPTRMNTINDSFGGKSVLEL
jgi:1,4-alpha-glucan branching enzyme